jgi:hypothetical protein
MPLNEEGKAPNMQIARVCVGLWMIGGSRKIRLFIAPMRALWGVVRPLMSYERGVCAAAEIIWDQGSGVWA